MVNNWVGRMEGSSWVESSCSWVVSSLVGSSMAIDACTWEVRNKQVVSSWVVCSWVECSLVANSRGVGSMSNLVECKMAHSWVLDSLADKQDSTPPLRNVPRPSRKLGIPSQRGMRHNNTQPPKNRSGVQHRIRNCTVGCNSEVFAPWPSLECDCSRTIHTSKMERMKSRIRMRVVGSLGSEIDRKVSPVGILDIREQCTPNPCRLPLRSCWLVMMVQEQVKILHNRIRSSCIRWCNSWKGSKTLEYRGVPLEDIDQSPHQRRVPESRRDSWHTGHIRNIQE